jgi:hypothetical protein
MGENKMPIGLKMVEYGKLVGRSYITIQKWRSEGKIKGERRDGIIWITEGRDGEKYGEGGKKIEEIEVGNSGEKVVKPTEDSLVVKLKAELAWLLQNREAGYTQKVKDLADAIARLTKADNNMGNPDNDLTNKTDEELKQMVKDEV